MPRPRQPSDDEHNERRRKIRPHVKIHHSIRNHPKAGPVFADLEKRAILTGLLLIASERGAAHTGNRVWLSAGDITWLTGRKRARSGLEPLWNCCVSMAFPVQFDGVSAVVEIPKFAEKQGLTPRDERSEERTPRSPPHPSPHTTQKREKKGAEPAPRSPDSLLWEAMVSVLVEQGMTPDAARRFLGHFCRNGNKPKLMGVAGRLIAERPADARAYIAKHMQPVGQAHRGFQP